MAVGSESTVTDAAGLPPLTCSVFSSFEGLAATRDEWDAFVERVGGDIYSTFDWCRTWWEFYGKGRRLEIVLVRQGEDLVGIFPFFHETQWLGGVPLRLIRLVGCDHSVTTANIVVEQGLEKEVFEAWVEMAAGKWDAIIFSPLPGYEGRGRGIAEAVGLALPDTRVEYRSDCGPHIVFDLPESFDEYLVRLSKKERGNIVRKERQVRQDFAVETPVRVEVGEVAEAFNRFLPLHQALWEGKGRLGHFGDWPDAVAFHKTLIGRLAKKGRVLFFELEVEDAVAASKYCLVFGPRMHTFMTGRDDAERFKDYSLGTVVWAALVDHAMRGRVRQLDAMRGYYDYKLRQGGRLAHLQSIVATRRTARSRLAFRLFRAGSWLLDTAYYRLWFRRIAPFLGIKRGPLWRVWIRSRL